MDEAARRQAIRDHIRRDPFAAHLGAAVEILAPGHARARLTIREELANFHGTAHGGAIFALGDMAFAAASNSHGQTAVALQVGISFLRAARVGDRLVAEAREEQAGRRTALYEISVRDERTGELVAKSQNLVYRKSEWFVAPAAADLEGNAGDAPDGRSGA